MKKIKLTESQLKILQKNLMEDYEQIDELGKEELSYEDGKLRRGQSKGPDPYEMAQIVIKNIRLHPSYYKDRNKMYEFLDAITTMLVDEVEEGGLDKIDYDDEMTTIDRPQLNEAQIELKKVFEKHMVNEDENKAMEQLQKTYPAPPPQPKEKKKFDITETPEFMAEKVQFKSLFKNTNIESFRKELYKYIHSNKSNPKLVDKLLKLLYKP